MDYKKLKENEPIQIIGHDNADNDSITSAYFLQKLLKYKNIESKIVIPDGKLPKEFDMKVYNFNYYTALSNESPIFLVDHMETKYKNKVIGYIDHHENVVYIGGNNIIKPRSSCAKIIFDEMLSEGMVLDKSDYYLVIKSMYLDTVSFTSEKAIEADQAWSDFYCKKYEFNKNKLYEEGLRLLDIDKMTQKDLKNDYKEFLINGNLIGSSGIRVKKVPSENKIEKMINDLKYIKNLDKKDFWLYYIVCVDDNKTLSFLISNDNIKKMSFNGIKSRGKDLVPILCASMPKKEAKTT